MAKRFVCGTLPAKMYCFSIGSCALASAFLHANEANAHECHIGIAMDFVEGVESPYRTARHIRCDLFAHSRFRLNHRTQRGGIVSHQFSHLFYFWNKISRRCSVWRLNDGARPIDWRLMATQNASTNNTILHEHTRVHATPWIDRECVLLLFAQNIEFRSHAIRTLCRRNRRN